MTWCLLMLTLRHVHEISLQWNHRLSPFNVRSQPLCIVYIIPVTPCGHEYVYGTFIPEYL